MTWNVVAASKKDEIVVISDGESDITLTFREIRDIVAASAVTMRFGPFSKVKP